MNTEWDVWCPWCWAKSGEPCRVTSSRYPSRNGVVAPVHHARRLYARLVAS